MGEKEAAKVAVVERKKLVAPGWRCTAHFMGRIPHPTDDVMAGFVPVELMAHLPENGGLACVLVACQVEDVDKIGKKLTVGVRIAAPLWHDELEGWVKNTLLPMIEKGYVALTALEVPAEGGRAAYVLELPPMYGSELEVTAYYPKDVVQSPEEFVNRLGVFTTMRLDNLAWVNRQRVAEAVRAERLRVAEAERAEAEACELQRPWGRVKAALRDIAALPVRAWDWAFPPMETPASVAEPVAEPSESPLDPWAEKERLVSATFLAACEQGMGSLLRRVTTRSPAVALYLRRKEGVHFGESLTQVEEERRLLQVTRVDTVTQHRQASLVFEVARLEGLDNVADAPDPRLLGTHEVYVKRHDKPSGT